MTHIHFSRLLLSLAAAAGWAVASAAAQGQTWETLQNLDGRSSKAILLDPYSPPSATWPNLLVTGEVAGLTDAAGAPYKVFRLTSPDALGSSSSDLEPLHASGAVVHSMASDPAGVLYWAGGLTTSSGNKWIVRRSTDGGLTWQEVRRLELAPGSYAEARGITADGAGRVVVGGLALDSAGVCHWVVEVSSDHGATWALRDLFKGTGAASIPTGYHIVAGLGSAFVPGPTGGWFVVGTKGNRYSGA